MDAVGHNLRAWRGIGEAGIEFFEWGARNMDRCDMDMGDSAAVNIAVGYWSVPRVVELKPFACPEGRLVLGARYGDTSSHRECD